MTSEEYWSRTMRRILAWSRPLVSPPEPMDDAEAERIMQSLTHFMTHEAQRRLDAQELEYALHGVL